jgi:sphinganine-1-phosphate aldolase
MAAAITSNTIALVCSAPCYSQGVIDPVEQLASLAIARGLPLHVDCCLGSFLIPFANSARTNRSVPLFDFLVPGVTSISCDPHKFGFAPKGSSVIMYSSEKYRHAQYFVAPEWTGGIYASPSIAGSRPGALIAACWATMVHIGRDGYFQTAVTILEAAQIIADGIRTRTSDTLRLMGDPDLAVVCFSTKNDCNLSIYNIGDEMT